MIKTYIIEIQSRNLTHDHRLLAFQKVSFQMILKNKVKNDPSSGSNFLSLNRDRDRLQKYWANIHKNRNDRMLTSLMSWKEIENRKALINDNVEIP